jgi:anti-sigma regulatory factor (Ser/Thr protein kinase)
VYEANEANETNERTGTDRDDTTPPMMPREMSEAVRPQPQAGTADDEAPPMPTIAAQPNVTAEAASSAPAVSPAPTAAAVAHVAPAADTPTPPSTLPGVVRLTVPSDPRYLCLVREAVGRVARCLGADDETCFQLQLAVDEAVTNVIRHAYGDRHDQPIEMTFEPRGDPSAVPCHGAEGTDTADGSNGSGNGSGNGNGNGHAASNGHAVSNGHAEGPGHPPASGGPCGNGRRPAPIRGKLSLMIGVRDYGRSVDPSTIKSRDLDDFRPGGLGVHIIRSIMDEVEYVPQPGGGMSLRLVKNL